MKKKLLLALGTCAVVGASIGATYASDTADCSSVDRSTIESVLGKQRAGTTLTDAETTLLESVKTCFDRDARSGSGRINRTGSGMMDGGRGPRFGSGMTASGMTMPHGVELADTEKESLKTMTDTEKKAFFESKWVTMGSGMTAPQGAKQEDKKTGLRAKLQSSHAKSADSLVDKYMKSIDSKTTDEKVAAIDAFLAKIATAQTKIQSSAYSDTVKTKYANVLDYMKVLFEDQKSSLSSGEDTDGSLLDSLLQ